MQHGGGGEHPVDRAYRLRRRRSGLGRRRDALRRPHARAPRHLDLRRRRPGIAPAAGQPRDAAGLAFAQGARRGRPDDRQPRARRRRRCRRFHGRPGHLRCHRAGTPAPGRQVADRRQGRPPLRLRRPLRLYLADRRGLCRQHRHDPRPRRAREPARGRPLVGARPMARRRRGLPGRRGGAVDALPPPVALRRPASRQLLAPRLLHPRHRRSVAPHPARRTRQRRRAGPSDP